MIVESEGIVLFVTVFVMALKVIAMWTVRLFSEVIVVLLMLLLLVVMVIVMVMVMVIVIVMWKVRIFSGAIVEEMPQWC